jgi:hypothetical protein
MPILLLTLGLFVILYLEIGSSVCVTLPLFISFIITYLCMKYSLYLIHIVLIMYLLPIINSYLSMANVI